MRFPFDAYLTYYPWVSGVEPDFAPQVALMAGDYTSVREAAEQFELSIREIRRKVIDEWEALQR